MSFSIRRVNLCEQTAVLALFDRQCEIKTSILKFYPVVALYGYIIIRGAFQLLLPKSQRIDLKVTIGTQNKKEYADNQSYARRSAVLPDMGQTEKERRES